MWKLPLIVMLLLMATSDLPSRVEASIAAPTDYDQYMLELINRARSDPAAEAVIYGIALNEGVPPADTISTDPKQPLAFSGYLNDAAQGHSQWMLDTDTFSNTGNGGSSARDRMESAGYSFTALPAGSGENLAWTGTTGPLGSLATRTEELHGNLFVDSGYPDRGHRTTIMNPDYKEIGVGVLSGVFTSGGTDFNAAIVTTDFAFTAGDSFLLGVVYYDTSGDNFYTPSEGYANVTITAVLQGSGTSFNVMTWNSGGYQLQLPAGTYDVTATHATLGEAVSNNVAIASSNVKLDFQPDDFQLPPTVIDLVANGLGDQGHAGTVADPLVAGETVPIKLVLNSGFWLSSMDLTLEVSGPASLSVGGIVTKSGTVYELEGNPNLILIPEFTVDENGNIPSNTIDRMQATSFLALQGPDDLVWNMFITCTGEGNVPIDLRISGQSDYSEISSTGPWSQMTESDLGDLTLHQIVPPEYMLTTSVVGNIGGAIIPASATHPSGSVVVLTAIPDEDWQVKAWTGTDNDSSIDTVNTVTMTGNKTVTVEFERIAITYYVNGNCGDDSWSGMDPCCMGPDGPKGTIQDTINTTLDADTVVVFPGHYYENVDFWGKAITVTGTDPNDPNIVGDTIIDANGDGIVVSFHSNEGPYSAISGFTITGGHARYGAGIACWDNCSPTIRHCVITENHADDIPQSQGAGMYCRNNANPGITSCIFSGNITGNHGAGIYNHYSSPTLTNCTLLDNSVSSGGGGGMYNTNSDPLLTDCTFNNNYGAGAGGGMYNESSSPMLNRCDFADNSASSGGGMYNRDFSSPTLTTCTFSGNEASSGNGGGMHNRDHCNPELTDCTFSAGSANVYGGGMYNYGGSSPRLTGCTFAGNSAGVWGGGACNYDNSGPTLIDCTFSCNWASEDGGGMYNRKLSSPAMINCTFSGNAAASGYGGGIGCDLDSSPAVRNCTLTGNRAATGGGGIDLGEGCDAVITNSIISSSPSGSGIYAIYSTPVIAYNNVYGNADGNYGGWATGGNGDISVDPCFIDPGYWDDPCNTPGDLSDDVWADGNYHLHHDSLCINAGDPCFLPDPCEVDMDGEPRVRLGRVDMGADEAGSNPADFDESGYVDLWDFDSLAGAWLSDTDTGHWKAGCDISKPADEVIDRLDFVELSREWLWEAPWY